MPQAARLSDDRSIVKDQLGLDDDSMDFLMGGSNPQPMPQARPQQRVAEPTAPAVQPEPNDFLGDQDASFLNFDPQREDESGQQVTSPATDGDPGTEEEGVLYLDIDTDRLSTLLPVETIDSEFPFDFGEGAKYRDFQQLRKGVIAKEKFISQLQTDKQQYETELEQAREQLAELRSEMDSVVSLYRKGMDEEQHLAMLAVQYMPEDMRGLSERDFNVTLDDYKVDRDSFIESWLDQNGPDVTLYAGSHDEDFKKDRRAARVRAQAAFEREETLKRREYERVWNEKQTQKLSWINARNAAVRKLQEEASKQQGILKANQTTYMERLRKGKSALLQEATPKNLGVRNSEQALVIAEILTADVDVFDPAQGQRKAKLQDTLLNIRAAYGSQLTDLILDGIKYRVSGGVTPSSSDTVVTAQPQRVVKKLRVAGPRNKQHSFEDIDNKSDWDDAWQ